MAIRHVTNISKGLGINAGALPALDTTGANLLILSLSMVGTGTVTVSDSKSNTWIPLTRRTGPSTHSQQFFYAQGATVGSGHVVTVTGTGIYVGATLHAVAGATTTPFDVQNGATAASGTVTKATGSITPSSNGAFILTALSQSGTAANPAAPTLVTPPMTQVYHPGSGGSWLAVSTAFWVQDTASAVNPTWTWTDTGGGVVAVASFLPASSAGAVEHAYPFVGLPA